MRFRNELGKSILQRDYSGWETSESGCEDRMLLITTRNFLGMSKACDLAIHLTRCARGELVQINAIPSRKILILLCLSSKRDQVGEVDIPIGEGTGCLARLGVWRCGSVVQRGSTNPP